MENGPTQNEKHVQGRMCFDSYNLYDEIRECRKSLRTKNF